MNLVLNPLAIAGMFAEETGIVGTALYTKSQLVATVAKRLVHVDNGRLMGSITVIRGHDDRGMVCLVGSNVEYALFQELEVGDTFPPGADPYTGAPRVRAGGKAFLRPALDIVKSGGTA